MSKPEPTMMSSEELVASLSRGWAEHFAPKLPESPDTIRTLDMVLEYMAACLEAAHEACDESHVPAEILPLALCAVNDWLIKMTPG